MIVAAAVLLLEVSSGSAAGGASAPPAVPDDTIAIIVNQSNTIDDLSLKDLRTVFQQCTQHQIDFLCRDSERLFRHGGRTLEAASNLLARGVQS